MPGRTKTDIQTATGLASKNCEHYGVVLRSSGSRTFINSDTNTSVRGEYNKADYNYYRPNEAISYNIQELMKASQTAYERVPVIRSVIDMMGDFTVQGIRITHPNQQIENFLQDWKKTVNFEGVSERIANMLYRIGSCPIKKRFGKVPVYFEKEWRKAYSDMSTDDEDIVVLKKEAPKHRTLPLSYTILDPCTIEVIGGEISAFIGKPLYALKISQKFKQSFIKLEREAAKSSQVHDMLQFIPDDLKTAVKSGKAFIPIDPNKLEVLFYKKDDWKCWATPMLTAILDSLVMLEKMHLADFSALDGAISQIRLWKLGNLELGIFPEPDAINKLRDMLAKVGTGGVIDLVWGPDLDFKESSSQVHHYLASEKYNQVMTEIYSGLGVPQTLTGTSGSGGQVGFTNNSISMQTLIERLEYGRKIVLDFWERELKCVQKAMDWRFAPQVIFDYKVLSDANTERAIMLDMWDRDIISTETIRELCRRDPQLEELRIKREHAKRTSTPTKIPPKASPYHNPQQDFEMKKLAMQSGTLAPSEMGVQLQPKKPGEVAPLDKQADTQMKVATMKEKMRPKIKKPGGRPIGKKDKSKRATKKVTPRSSAFNLFVWAEKTQDELGEIVNPTILEKFNKKNMRSLTKGEVTASENLKHIILTHIEPYSQISKEIVYNILAKNPTHNPQIYKLYGETKQLFEQQYDRNPTVEECREIFSTAYARVKSRDLVSE